MQTSGTLTNCLLQLNRTEGGRGGPAGDGGASQENAGKGGPGGSGGHASGGALYGAGAIKLVTSYILTNYVLGGDAGPSGNGGGLGGYGAYEIIASRLGYGGGGSPGGEARGGGVSLLSTSAVLVASRVLGNVAHGGAGGNAGTNGGILAGASPLAISPAGGIGGAALGGGVYSDRAQLAITSSTFAGNGASAGPSGLSGPGGGSFFNYPWSSITLGYPSTNGSGGATARGGALFSDACDINLTATTLNANRCIGGQGGAGGARHEAADTGGTGGTGGEAFGSAIAQNDGRLRLTNTTFYSNSVIGGIGGLGGANNGGAPGGPGGSCWGGAIHSLTGIVLLVNASFADNLSFAGSGGMGGTGETNTIGATGPPGTASGSTLANVGADFALANSFFKHHPAGTNGFGPFVDLGNNISSDASIALSQPGSRTGLDPLAGPLADNGGPTVTLALRSGSPCIDAARDDHAPAVDQRGVARSYGPHADIGAYEAQQPTFTISGYVMARSGVSGVIISVGDVTAVTDMAGFYSLGNLFAGTYEVRPQPLGSGFVPASRSVTLGPSPGNVNFSARPPLIELAPADGTVTLRIAGAPAQIYIIETSTDLVDWIPTITLETGSNGWSLLSPLVCTNESCRFFRGRYE